MRVGIKAQKKLFAKPRKKLLSSIWNNCYKDGRRLARCLGLDALNLSPTLTQAEIASMLDAGAALEPQRSQLGVDQMAVLPVNLMAPLSTENAALVTKDERRRLFARLRSVQKFLKKFLKAKTKRGPARGCLPRAVRVCVAQTRRVSPYPPSDEQVC
jgi:hypothetical protein